MPTSNGIYAREFVGPVTRGYRRDMGQIVARKIRQLRISLGLNQSEFAERLGVTQATVSRWEKGAMPEGDKLAKLAEMAGENVRAFIDEPSSTVTTPAHLERFWVRGAVAAGVWATAYELPQTEWVEYSGGAHVKVPQGQRFGLRCRGDSMNQVYPDGTIVDCVKVEAVGEIRSGQRVIVEQRRHSGEVEATVKEYVIGEDGKEWLVPRSNNPAFQAPIAANEPAEGIDEVRIVAVVVGSYRPE